MHDRRIPDRRSFLTTSISLAGTLAAPALVRAQSLGSSFKGQTLKAMVYSGINENTWRKFFVPQFEAATGAKLIIDAAWTEGVAKLKASPGSEPPFDILMTDPIQGYPTIDEGLLQKVNLANIPNFQKFHNRVRAGRVPEESWGVSFISSAMTLSWNTEAVPGGLQNWGQLLDAPARGNMMLCALYYMSIYTFACMKAAKENAVGKAAQMCLTNLDDVLNFARANRDAVKYWWPNTAEAVNTLVRKNVIAGNIHGNGLLAPMRDGRPVAGVIPTGDVAYVPLFLVVPKNVRNPALVEAALNHFCSEEFQRSSAETGELPANILSVAQAHAPKDKVWATAYPDTAAEFEALRFYPYEAYFKDLRKVTNTWEREIMRKS